MEPNMISKNHPIANPFILLPHKIKQNAHDNPSAVFARTPRGGKYTDGYRDVTNLAFANAIDFTANLIEKSLGKGQNFETVAYIGPGDIRYSIVVVAGAKAGYKVFLPSPRNSKEAHLSLLKKLQCTKLIASEPHAPCIPMILGEMQLQIMTLPSLQQLLEVENVDEYLFDCSFKEAKNDPIFVLHTSGSTGIPKPLDFTHDFVSRIVMGAMLPPPEGYVDINRHVVRGRFFMTLPSFHIAGLGYSLIIATYCGSIPVYPLPGPPPTTESFISAISNTDVDWAFVPPVVIDEMGKDPGLLEKVASRLKYLFFTGGSVPKASGNVVAQRLPIWQVLGSSECGSLPLVHADKEYKNSEDWRYVQVHPSLKAEMRHRIDDLYELVIVRNPETEALQPVFAHFQEMTEYETRDLFRAHPTKEGLWAHQSRIDDVIVFLNGEKTNPVSFEEELISHPEVKAALVIGAQRFEAALLVELATDAQFSEEEKSDIIDRIWPVVESANKVTPAHARVTKGKILLVDPKIPMLRAGKGTVQRSATLTLYAGEIDRLYQEDEARDVDVRATLSDKDNIKSVIRDLVADMMGWDDLNFFQLGMDSLGVLRLQRALKSRLPGNSLSLNAVYSNPSVNALAKEIEKAATANGKAQTEAEYSTEELAKELEYYCKKIDAIGPITCRETMATNNIPTAVLLTGSTGALGSYILNRLLSLPKVTHIYCLNRTSDAKDRQIKSNQVRDLIAEFPPDRVTFLAGDLTKPNFGVQENEFQDLLSKATHIIHCAWPVNFNHSLSTFGPSLSGIVSLIQFTVLTKQRSSIQFFSSISSVSSYSGSVVPESVIPELSTPAAMGYGQSKYLAERMLDHACKKLGIHASSVRIGQVAGAARTCSGWNRQEWLPSLVVSSALVGALPETLGDVPTAEEMINWVPIDHLADTLVELGLRSEPVEAELGVAVFQITHPKPVPWSSLLKPIKSTLEASSRSSEPIKIIPYADWLSVLKAKSVGADEETNSIHSEALVRKNPAMKLLGFYDSLLYQGDAGLRTKLAIDKALKFSETLRELEPIEDEWMSGWVREWISG